jgi:hypothetical protein
MGSEATVESCGAELRESWHEDVLLVVFAGLYTRAADIRTRATAHRATANVPTRAVILDLRAAVHVMNSAQIEDCATIALATPLRVPVAIVTSHASFHQIARVCARLRRAGLLCVPFLRRADAVDWAAGRPRPHQ